MNKPRLSAWADTITSAFTTAMTNAETPDGRATGIIFMISAGLKYVLKLHNPALQLCGLMYGLIHANQQLKDLNGQDHDELKPETRDLITIASDTFKEALQNLKDRKILDAIGNISKAAITGILASLTNIMSVCMDLMIGKNPNQGMVQGGV